MGAVLRGRKSVCIAGHPRKAKREVLLRSRADQGRAGCLRAGQMWFDCLAGWETDAGQMELPSTIYRLLVLKGR